MRFEPDRLGIMCHLGSTEASARAVLRSARRAGFRRAQVNFPWDQVKDAFLRGLPGWLSEEGIEAPVLSAYVNCVEPANILMATRAEDFDRAIEYAPRIGATHLVAWTGGYGRDLMTADPRNFRPEASEGIRRFLGLRGRRLAALGLTLALETYNTLACPTANLLRSLCEGLPRVTAVIDPPNLIPIADYERRDEAMRTMFQLLLPKAGVVHCKDFRLRAGARQYELPGPLAGELNYGLFAEEIRKLPPTVPVIAEHVGPEEFAATRQKLLPVLVGSGGVGRG
jgi:sugar phosphate isomerase/epimerase